MPRSGSRGSVAVLPRVVKVTTIGPTVFPALVSETLMLPVCEALKPDVSPTDLAKLAESDPGFALRIISMVNSAAFGFSRKVSDVRQATAFIGVRGLRTLGLSLAVSLPSAAEAAPPLQAPPKPSCPDERADAGTG